LGLGKQFESGDQTLRLRERESICEKTLRESGGRFRGDGELEGHEDVGGGRGGESMNQGGDARNSLRGGERGGHIGSKNKNIGGIGEKKKKVRKNQIGGEVEGGRGTKQGSRNSQRLKRNDLTKNVMSQI